MIRNGEMLPAGQTQVQCHVTEPGRLEEAWRPPSLADNKRLTRDHRGLGL